MNDIAIRAMSASEAEARLDELAGMLTDAVAQGASVFFMAGFSREDGRKFWRSQLPGIAAGEKLLLVGDDGTRLVGTVMLMFALQPNAWHRAEIGKMLVHSSAQRRGLGRRLLAAAEEEARKAGRTLLLLDTEAGSAGEHLYRVCGWSEIGRIVGYHHSPDGRLSDTVLFRKTLA
jgi:GNAT superfamily N-acetyltransferase